ncbi:MAG: hypothetical protein JWQ35_338 [Bacteriovoracaceae bacterium]|nr:hypothetical protein [Bacteriovoracaceae bacterium]
MLVTNEASTPQKMEFKRESEKKDKLLLSIIVARKLFFHEVRHMKTIRYLSPIGNFAG